MKQLPKPKTLGEAFKVAYSDLIAQTTHAHPSLDQRLSYIDKVVAEQQQRGHTVQSL